MKLVFWDFDGTIIDSEIIYKKALMEYLNNKNVLLKEIDDTFFYKKITGCHPESFFEDLKNEGYIEKDFILTSFNEIREAYEDYFDNLGEGGIQVLQGMNEVIDEIGEEEDIIMSVVSSTTDPSFKIKQKAIKSDVLTKYFEFGKNIYLCNLEKNIKFKPAPDVYNYAFKSVIERLNLNISSNDKIFIVEDSPAGCEAANAFRNTIGKDLNITIIGTLVSLSLEDYKEEYSKKLKANGADLIANIPQDIVSYIK